MKQLTLTIPVNRGELCPSKMQELTISGFLRPFDGKAVRVVLSKPTTTRTTSQNRLYWGVVVQTIATETGHTSEEIHSILKQLFLPRRFVTVAGKEHQLHKTTTELTTEEFTLYLEQIRAWASTELNITLPLENGDIP